jgi:MerR family transcriptional regulator, light-induced transcriptional regulator
MATVFGISGLRSRLADWRGNWKVGVPWPSGNTDDEASSRTDAANDDLDLSRVIENLVIPRLIANLDSGGGTGSVTAHAGSAQATSDVTFNRTDIVQFSMLSLQDNPEAMFDFIDARLAVGCSVETLYVELLAPAARALGTKWEDDSLDFVDVTMGLWRIQEILRELSARIPPKSAQKGFPMSALFSPMPGEQHSFGSLMVSDCFERAGWQVDALIEPSQSQLNVKCAEQFYDLIGLTVTADCTSASLRSLVTTIRAISRNPDVQIMVGGRFINEHPELVEASGADATAVDAISAVALADQMAKVKMDVVDRF